MTYIGEYYDRDKKNYMACHYSLLVYSFKNSKCFYWDSLGLRFVYTGTDITFQKRSSSH